MFIPVTFPRSTKIPTHSVTFSSVYNFATIYPDILDFLCETCCYHTVQDTTKTCIFPSTWYAYLCYTIYDSNPALHHHGDTWGHPVHILSGSHCICTAAATTTLKGRSLLLWTCGRETFNIDSLEIGS